MLYPINARISARISEGPGNPLSLPERLRALPVFEPPAGGWTRLSQRMQARRRRYVQAGGGLALAASLLLAVALVGLRPANAPQPGFGASTPPASNMAQLIDRSQRLEHRLAQARPQVAVWDSGRADRAALLEARLQRVDAQLNFADPETAELLWRNRVELMSAMVELHEPQAPALQYASYQY
jgi:hypothetical protein